jgi:hypothetical protein
MDGGIIMKKVTLLFFFIAIVGFLSLPKGQFVEGKEKSVLVKPIYPYNQSQEIRGYYSLDVQDEKEQTIELMLSNISEKEKKVTVHRMNALTAQNGGIQYVAHTGTEVASLLDESYGLASYLKAEEGITLPPQSEKRLSVTITMPKKRSGSYLGGLLFEEEKEQKETSGSFTVHQQILVGMALQLNFEKKEKATISYENSRVVFLPAVTQLQMALKNDSLVVVKGIKGEYEVHSKKGEKLFEGTFENVDMAPKTKIYYPVLWNHEEISESEYTIHLTLERDGERKKYNDVLVVQKQKTEKRNDDSEEKRVKQPVLLKEKTSPSLWLFLGIVLVIASFAAFALKRRK